MRQRRAASAQRAKPRGSRPSILARTAWANTGAAPSVEMPMTSGERLTMAPKMKSHSRGLSTTLTGTPARRAAAAKRSASASSAMAPMATAAPARSVACQARSPSEIRPCGGAAASARSSSPGAAQIHFDLGAGGGQQFRLPGRRGRGAADDRPLAFERQEHRQPRQRPHPRARLLGAADRQRLEASRHCRPPRCDAPTTAGLRIAAGNAGSWNSLRSWSSLDGRGVAHHRGEQTVCHC